MFSEYEHHGYLTDAVFCWKSSATNDMSLFFSCILFVIKNNYQEKNHLRSDILNCQELH